jgi:hypothetical protein
MWLTFRVPFSSLGAEVEWMCIGACNVGEFKGKALLTSAIGPERLDDTA